MKIWYRFADGDVEIEISDEWGEVILDMDRREHKNHRRETRRHISLNMMGEQGVQFAEKPSDEMTIFEMLESLPTHQQMLVRRIVILGESLSSIAREEGVSRQAIHDRLGRALKQIMKNFE